MKEIFMKIEPPFASSQEHCQLSRRNVGG